MKHSYKFETGMDCSIILEIDDSVMTPEHAKEVVSFWSGGDDVLEESDGDIFQAVGRFCASRLLKYLIDGYNENGSVMELYEQEGYGIPGGQLGVRIVDHEIPDFDPTWFQVERL